MAVPTPDSDAAPCAAPPDLSVIIVSYNTRDLLRQCLASLHGESADVIVVDNDSHDGSAAMVRESYPQVRLVEMGENAGFARASNAGMRIAAGRYLVLLNSDTVARDGALRRMVAFLEARAQFAAAGPLLLNPDGSVQTSCFAFTTVRDVFFEQIGLTRLFSASPFFNRRGLGGFDRSVERPVDWVSGACLVVRRSVVQQVGMLDEGFFMYGEELDWCLRMKMAGLQTAFYPGARVTHYGGASSARTRAGLAPRALAGRLRYFAKHHGQSAVTAVRIATLLGAVLRLPAALCLALLRPQTGRSYLAWNWAMLGAAFSADPGNTNG